MKRNRAWEIGAGAALLLALVLVAGAVIGRWLHQKHLDDQMTAAMRQLDAAAVRSLLARGASANVTVDGETALMRAARGGGVEVARALIEGGADLKAKTGSGQTTLAYLERSEAEHQAARKRGEMSEWSSNHGAVARLLKQHGATR